MKSDKFYRYATLGLALLNLAILAFFLLHEPPPRGPKAAFRNRAVEILKLDEAQNDLFEEMATQHQGNMRKIRGEQKTALKAYFSGLTGSNSEGKPGGSLEAVKDWEAKKITTTYEHFEEVRSILKPDQEPLFEEFVAKALDILLLDKGKRKHPPKKHH